MLKLPFKGSGRLTPGHYKIKFTSGLQVEELQGMHGIEEYRPLTVLPAPKAGLSSRLLRITAPASHVSRIAVNGS